MKLASEIEKNLYVIKEGTFILFMIKKNKNKEKYNLFFPELEKQLNPKNYIYILSKKLPWDELELKFQIFYKNYGRPAKPIRLMISLILLKNLYNLTDEEVVSKWIENPYWQFFSGMEVFQWKKPCDPSDLAYFRKRIGNDGLKEIRSIENIYF